MFDFAKTYAAKKGLVAALRKEDVAENVTISQNAEGRWFAAVAVEEFEASKEELAAQTIRPSNVEFDLTDNEFHAACILVRDCFQGMGGSRPSDLSNDEYTWVYAESLVRMGWSKESAAGTFSALDNKGVIFEYEKNQMVLETAAWQWLDTKWDDKAKALSCTNKEHLNADAEDAEPVAPVAPVAKAPKAKAEKVNGVRFPREGGLCWQAWMMFDELFKANPAFNVKDALAEGAKRNFNDNNVRTELCVWRKYHGVAARPNKG